MDAKEEIMAVVQEQNAPLGAGPREVRIVAHSTLFYWWPVWAVGLLMTAAVANSGLLPENRLREQLATQDLDPELALWPGRE